MRRSRPGRRADPLRDKSLKTGASAYVQADLRDAFVKDFVFPAIRANALYEGSTCSARRSRGPASSRE
ncbi:MAG: argininosuccinate synthase [Polyangiaceae bacterium]